MFIVPQIGHVFSEWKISLNKIIIIIGSPWMHKGYCYFCILYFFNQAVIFPFSPMTESWAAWWTWQWIIHHNQVIFFFLIAIHDKIISSLAHTDKSENTHFNIPSSLLHCACYVCRFIIFRELSSLQEAASTFNVSNIHLTVT